MEEMRIYIANLGKYNEGELVGAWFTPPVDFEEVKERIGLNDEYEEYAIHDYELPFEIDEYTPIFEIETEKVYSTGYLISFYVPYPSDLFNDNSLYDGAIHR